MTDTSPDLFSKNVPDDFFEDVKQVLENLYDFPYLQRHPLAQSAPQTNGNENAGQRLRREVIVAIEAHNPGENVFFRSPHARLYNLLHLHYVEGMTIQEVSNDLGISTRQAYRDLKRGQIGIAEVLWTNRKGKRKSSPSTSSVDDAQLLSEVSRLKTNPVMTPMASLVRTAIRAVERLAEAHHIMLDLHIPSAPITISTNPIIAQQVIVNLLSHSIKQAQSGKLRIQLDSTQKDITLQLRFFPHQDSYEDQDMSHVIVQLVDYLGWEYTQFTHPEKVIIKLKLTNNAPTVLIIDDNEALIDLLKRYLADQSPRVVAAQQGEEGIRLAREIQPDLIVLDVMMPGMDGWEVLQRLRTYPNMSTIPIIVCSVFNDPELAMSLGASLMLPKPVSKEAFLDALEQVGLL